MQSAMQMFVARFASKDPRIRGGTDAKRTPNIGGVSFYVWGGMNAGVLQLRFRMTTKNKRAGHITLPHFTSSVSTNDFNRASA